ncbi:MAG TPA: transglycosylase SLT domain-containing protein [Chloroflexota bacterium]|nr:transglycosylase SLT domain-containing protein [Chloroflexota bacterium]
MTVYEQRYPQRQPVVRKAPPITILPAPEYDEVQDYWIEDERLWHGEYTGHGMHPIQQRMMIILAFVVVGTLLFVGLAAPRIQGKGVAGEGATTGAVNTAAVASFSGGGIAPLFTREVQHWTPQIMAWAAEHGLDPNMVATVMQIESCGDPAALSIAGAQGLFQVMPFHFQPGENAFDPDMNAFRGMSFLATLVKQFGESGLAFAGYNGGPGNAVKAYDNWPAETKRYYYWATGIYEDAMAGRAESARLNEWLAAGGAGGCARAATSLGLR